MNSQSTSTLKCACCGTSFEKLYRDTLEGVWCFTCAAGLGITGLVAAQHSAPAGQRG